MSKGACAISAILTFILAGVVALTDVPLPSVRMQSVMILTIIGWLYILEMRKP